MCWSNFATPLRTIENYTIQKSFPEKEFWTNLSIQWRMKTRVSGAGAESLLIGIYLRCVRVKTTDRNRLWPRIGNSSGHFALPEENSSALTSTTQHTHPTPPPHPASAGYQNHEKQHLWRWKASIPKLAKRGLLGPSHFVIPLAKCRW